MSRSCVSSVVLQERILPQPSRIGRACTVLIAVAAAGCGAGAGPADTPMETENTVCAPPQSDGWLWVEVAEGTKPVLTLDDLGQLHLAFMLEAMSGWVRYAQVDRSTGAVSDTQTVAEGYFFGPFDLATGLGSVFVAYHDHTSEDLVLAERVAGGAWTSHPMVNPGHDGWHSSLAVGPSGDVHAGSFDPSAFDGLGVFYGRYVNEIWEVDLAAPGSFMFDGGLSLALGAGETSYIAFFDDVEGVAKIARRFGPGSWIVEVVEPKGSMLEAGRFPHLIVGDDGATLHLVYLARATPTTGVIRYATGPFGNLTIQDVAPIDDIQIGMGLEARNIVNVDLMSDGSPVIVFQSKSKTSIARWVAGAFDLEVLQAADGVRLRQQVSMAVDGDDRIHLTFWQGDFPGQVCYGRK